MSESGSELDPVGKLAESFLARYRRGERPALTEYTSQYPELAAQILEVFPALIMIEELGSVGGPEAGAPADRPAARSPVPRQLGEYRILREVGRGGMGVVYEAVQESLGRHVALKVFPGHGLLSPAHLERFRREAKAAAQLHHTNIVPVFGVGEDQGVHYYAMQFIRGQGLDSVLKELHRLRAPQGGNDPHGSKQNGDASIASRLLSGQWPKIEALHDSEPTAAVLSAPELSGQSGTEYFRSVARMGLQVAEALTHAHQQGILHRDIKPSNLLLDAHGTVWVTDFGLAKSEGSEDLTDTGDIVGTLRYMAPERFSGWSDPRSDVYGLGITLCEMLTLRPAFQEGQRQRLMNQVLHDEPLAPRKLDPHIPRDLETIVLKAIAKEPGDRYPSAEALADDLRRFLEDRTIQARRSSASERTWRWCRRNRFLAGACASTLLLLVTAMIAVTVGIVSVNRAKNRTEQALDAESIASQRAQQALDDMFSQVVEDWLSTRSQLEPAQKAFLEKALGSYEAFAAESGDHEDIRNRVGNALMHTGRIRDLLGQQDDALRAYSQAQALYEQLRQEHPDASRYRSDLAKSYTARGVLLQSLRRFPEAEAALRTSIDILKQQTVDFPQMPDLGGLAQDQARLGSLLSDSGQSEAAEVALREVLTTQQQLVAQEPGNVDYRLNLSLIYNSLAITLFRNRRAEGVEQAFRDSLAVLKQLTLDFPGVPRYRHELAVRHYNMGTLFMKINAKVAEAALWDALTIEKGLAADFPSVPTYRWTLANVQHNLAVTFSGMRRAKQAEAAYRDTAAMRRQLAVDFPSRPMYQEEAANGLNGLGIFLMDHGQPKEAEAAFREALAFRQELVRTYPTKTAYQGDVTQLRATLAVLWATTGDHARAMAEVTALQTNPHTTASAYYDLACASSLASAAVAKDAKLSPGERSTLGEKYAAQAVGFLSQSAAGGYATLSHLKTDSDLAPIRNRPEFRKLMQELEQAQKAGKGQ